MNFVNIIIEANNIGISNHLTGKSFQRRENKKMGLKLHEIMRVHIPQATTAKEKMHKKFRPLILFAKLHKQMHFETTHILVITFFMS